ncbi:MAG: hypothetical protein AAF907_08365, partial [Planctomycetota bacterium]
MTVFPTLTAGSAKAAWMTLCLIAGLAVIAALYDSGGTASVGAAAPTPDERPQQEPAAAEGADPSAAETDGDTRFVEQQLNAESSPFTRETVLELNGIVARSLAAIDEFDACRRAVPLEGGAAESSVRLAQLDRLSVDAAAARWEMTTAGARLRGGEERYNPAILAAMERFVNGVDG